MRSPQHTTDTLPFSNHPPRCVCCNIEEDTYDPDLRQAQGGLCPPRAAADTLHDSHDLHDAHTSLLYPYCSRPRTLEGYSDVLRSCSIDCRCEVSSVLY